MRIVVSAVPPAECSPNWRGPWVQRHRASRAYREEVFYVAVNVRNGVRTPWATAEHLFERARLDLTFIFQTDRDRDEDNLRARFKPGQDALVAASLIANDTPEYLVLGKVAIVVDPARAPKTIIDLEEVVNGEGKAPGD